MSKLAREFDLVVAGHFAIDRIKIRKAAEIVRIGGPPFYSAIAASRLGARVAVLSKVGGDFPEKYLKILESERVDVTFVHLIKDAKTTSFDIKYMDDKREMRLQALSPKLLPEDVPVDFKAKVVHIAPIANEIPYRTFERLRRNTDTVCLDAQGYARKFDEKGNVKLKEWRDKRFLEKTSILKADEKEATYISGFSNLHKAAKKIAEYGVKTVIITMADKGAVLLYNGKIQKIPAYPVNVVDPTGAGDTFMGAYIAEYVKRNDPVWCACVGSAAASILIERNGLLRFGFKDEIYERAEKLYGMIG